jgi:Beta-ketoacyl synthase, N-terminal domain
MSVAAYVGGIGVLGPGLGNWPETSAVLSGRRAYESAPTILPPPSLLPAAERRRTGRVVKLALAVASEAAAHARTVPADLRSVFSSSGGDGHNCHEICQALANVPREISPTRFSNSVHNAAAGYWSIGTGAMRASTVLCAFDASFGAGLLEALVQVTVDREPLLLVVYDTEYPDPLRAKRPIPDAFGVSLVLTPTCAPGSLTRIEASPGSESVESLTDPELESLRRSIPAARALPLLRKIAENGPGRTVLEYLDVSSLIVQVDPCNGPHAA